jgi:ribosome maturation factor RimP
MKSSMKNCIPNPAAQWALLLALAVGFLALTQPVFAQAPARFIGAITAISGNTLTVKPDSGDARQVQVPETASIKRISPGERDLSKAEPLPFANLAVGDRVLVKLDPSAPAGTQQAAQIVAVKQEDVALKQQREREDWQKRGIGGLVKSVDPAAGAIVVSSGTGATARTITVHTAKSTMLKRYAPASVSYEAALPAPIDAIHAGDQLRARGAKSADGSEIAAEEVVSGTFRNISGIVNGVDASALTLTLKDLASKKQVTVHIPKDAQMRRIPDRMAQMIAMRLKGGSAAAQGSGGERSSYNGSGAGPRGSGQSSSQGSGSQANGTSQWGAGGQAPDPQQFLNRAPAIQFADLKKGDAIMVVSTDGATEVTAITLLAGVEPLLEAPAAQNLLANWSMNSGGAADLGQ